MGLTGFNEYIDKMYNICIFNRALKSNDRWFIHIHKGRVVESEIIENLTYELKLNSDGRDMEVVPKIQIKYLYPEDLSDKILPLIKTDKKVKKFGMSFISSPAERHHVKNKSLYLLMKEKKNVIFTLLEGDQMSGKVRNFSRYDITVSMKGEVPVTILRHSIFKLKDKKGRSFLKNFQEKPLGRILDYV